MARRVDEAVEELDVARRAHRAEQLVAGVRPLRREALDHLLGRGADRRRAAPRRVRCRRSSRTSASRTAPSSPPSHFKLVAQGRGPLRFEERSGTSAGASADRRVATRAWCTASGSSPRRTPGVVLEQARRPTTRDRALDHLGDRRDVLRRRRARRRAPSWRAARARGRPSASGRARPRPASRRRSTIGAAASAGAVAASSISSSRNRLTMVPPSNTVTSSSTSSPSGRPSDAVERDRGAARVRSRATAEIRSDRTRACTRSRAPSGGAAGPPGKWYSRRARAALGCRAAAVALGQLDDPALVGPVAEAGPGTRRGGGRRCRNRSRSSRRRRGARRSRPRRGR